MNLHIHIIFTRERRKMSQNGGKHKDINDMLDNTIQTI